MHMCVYIYIYIYIYVYGVSGRNAFICCACPEMSWPHASFSRFLHNSADTIMNNSD